MSQLIPGPQLRTLVAGAKVDRGAAALPQTATGNIFTVTGGRIILLGLVGQVTTVIGASACTVSIGTIPTVGTPAVASIGAASASIASHEVGSLLGLAPVAGGQVVAGANAGAVTQLSDQGGYVIPAGAISITTVGSTTGTLSWSALWVPFDDGASLVAA